MVLAIDPGPEESAYVIWDGVRAESFGKIPNDALLQALGESKVPALVIEKIASFGMPVGAEVFETCVWTGRFIERFGKPDRTHRITRVAVKTHLCHSAKAKDGNIRQALIDRFGGPASIKKGGALYKVAGDVWSALAVAVTFQEQHQ